MEVKTKQDLPNLPKGTRGFVERTVGDETIIIWQHPDYPIPDKFDDETPIFRGIYNDDELKRFVEWI